MASRSRRSRGRSACRSPLRRSTPGWTTCRPSPRGGSPRARCSPPARGRQAPGPATTAGTGAQAAPHGREGVREAPGRAGLRRLPLNRAPPRRAPPRGDGQGARPQGRRGLPYAGLAARRGPGRLRGGGPRGPRRGRQGQAPGRRLPAPRRGARPGVLGRDLGVRLPGAPQRVRVRGRRAEEGRLRQRRRGRQARRGRGRDVGALPALRGAPRARSRPRRPLLGQREGQRRERGRVPREEPLRARPVVPRRRRVRPQAPRGLPGPRRAGAATGPARPSSSRSGRTKTRSRRCHRPRSRA